MKKTIDDIRQNEIADGLAKAKALIDHPDKWVQQTLELNGRICSLRAMQIATDNDERKIDAMGSLTGYKFSPQSSVCDLNNKLEHAELMQRFDQAITQQRAKA